MTRDSLIWWVGLVGGVLTAAAAQVDLFPEAWRSWITLAATIVAAVSGKLATSPLKGKDDADLLPFR